MAKIASKMSNQTILTSDNPRTEDPNTILEEMAAGIPEENQTKNITISDSIWSLTNWTVLLSLFCLTLNIINQ